MNNRRLLLLASSVGVWSLLSGPLLAQSFNDQLQAPTTSATPGATPASGDDATVLPSGPAGETPDNPSLIAPRTQAQAEAQVPSNPADVGSTLSSDYYAPQVAATGTSKLPFRLGLAVGLLVDDNIGITQENKEADLIEIFTPSFILETGRSDQERPTYASLTFDPDIQFFDFHPDDNAVDYHVVAAGQKTWNAKLMLGLSQAYDTFSGPNIDFGGRLSSEVYTTRFFGSYPLTHKINATWEADQLFTTYDQGYDNDEWKANTYIDYQAFPKTRIGLGIEGGYVDFVGGYTSLDGQNNEDRNDNQTYEGATLGVVYTYSQKLNFTGKAGGEYRQYAGATSSLTPIADVAAVWTPYQDTSIQLSLSRHTVQAISSHNTDYNNTVVAVTLQQKLFRDFTASLIASYSDSQYFSFDPTLVSTGLTHHYYTARPSLQWRPSGNYAFSWYYQFERNVSTFSDGFTDNQTGITASMSY